MVLQYYFALRSILHANPHLRACLTRYKHCGIFFLTHPRNAGRKDLGCPFGCRQANRKENSKKRSAEYYRSDEGKEKKKAHNTRRSIQGQSGDGSGDSTHEKLPCQDAQPIQDKVTTLTPSCEPPDQIIHDKVSLSYIQISYIQMLVSLIEGRYVSMDEVLEMLQKIVRQHSFDKRRRFVYDFTYSDPKPP